MISIAGLGDARADNEILGGLLGGGAGAGIGYALGGGKGAAIGGLTGLALGALAANQFWRNDEPPAPTYGHAPAPAGGGGYYGDSPPRQHAAYRRHGPGNPPPYRSAGHRAPWRDHSRAYDRRYPRRFPSGRDAAYDFPGDHRD
jgi:hypothetical protein